VLVVSVTRGPQLLIERAAKALARNRITIL